MSVSKVEQADAVTTFIWTIENFEMCPERPGEYLESPKFHVFSCPVSSFYLKLFAGGYNKEMSEFLSLFLRKSAISHEDNHVYCVTLGIITSEGKENYGKFKISNQSGLGYGKFIEKKKISSDKQLMLPNGNLTLFCKVSQCEAHFKGNNEDRIQLKGISDAFAELYENRKHSDTTIEAKGKSFKIHKAIIEARFPDLLKTVDGTLCKVENISAKTVEALLQYLYSGNLNISEVNVDELLASGYEIPNHLQSLLVTPPQKIKAVTSFTKHDISFTWKIQDFKSLEPGKCRCFHYKWYSESWTWFTIFLTVSTNKDSLNIFIDRYSKNCKKVICNIQMNRVNTTFIHTFGEDRFTSPCIPLQVFFTKDDLISSSEHDIILNFKISVSDHSKSEEITINELNSYESSAKNNAEDLLSLHNDLKSLHNNPKFSDVMLKCGEEKYRAHKCILCVRSATFFDVLQNDSPEKDDEVSVDLSSKVVKDLLFYIYCDDIEFNAIDEKHILDMYNAAVKYNLPGLKSKCSEFLKQSLRASIAAEVLIAAYDCDDTELKDFIYNFVCANLQDIAEKWEDTMKERPDISAEMLQKTLSHLASKQK